MTSDIDQSTSRQWAEDVSPLCDVREYEMGEKAEPTPGPWTIEWDKKSGQAVVQGPRLDGDVNGWGVGDVVAVDVADDNLTGQMFPPLSPESCANAHLIAAAPDLLRALEAAMDFIDKHPADPDISEDQTRAWMRLLDIDPKAVIAKARGETQ